MTDHELAVDLAAKAGALLLAIRAEDGERGRELGERGDREANSLLLDHLARMRASDGVLSEEAKDDRARCNTSRVWIIDPLDGTKEYSEGRNDWAVHVALAINGEPVCGAVALPAQHTIYSTTSSAAPPPLGQDLRMVVSRSRAPEIATRVARQIGAELVPMGSAGAKAMAVVAGKVDIYLHAGGQYEWDNCAPVAVARAHGLHASRLDGSPLVYNRTDPLLPDLLICNPEVLAIVSDAIRAVN